MTPNAGGSHYTFWPPRAFAVLAWRHAMGPAVFGVVCLALMAIRVAPEPDGKTAARADALFDAARRGDVAMLAEAIQRHEMSENEIEADTQMSLLMWAASNRRAEAVEWLLARGADLEAQTTRGTALVVAPSGDGGSAMVRMLLERGADPNRRTLAGHTPLMHAAMCGDVASAELLIRAGAHVNARDRRGNTALAIARTSDCDEMIRLLLAAGADPTAS
jgi:ankyrin repeat protein